MIFTSKLMKKIKVMILLSMVLPLLSSCWEDKNFHVREADISIDIEKLETGNFRVFVYRDGNEKGTDFIDIDYDMSDIHTIQLCIPKQENNRIFVIDRWHDVEDINSSELDFVLLSPEGAKNGKVITIAELDRLNRTLARIDSVMDSIPSVTIQLDPRLSNLYVWENGKYIYGRIVNPINIKE